MLSMGEYLVAYKRLMHWMLRYASIATMPTRGSKDKVFREDDKMFMEKRSRSYPVLLTGGFLQNYRSRRMVKYPERSGSPCMMRRNGTA